MQIHSFQKQNVNKCPGAEVWRFGIGNIPAAEAGGLAVGSQLESRKDNSEVGESQRESGYKDNVIIMNK